MYEELIENLRSVKDTWQTEDENWMLQAADAIEHLQKAVLRLEEESGILDELPLVDQSGRCSTCRYNGDTEFGACHICNNETDMYRPKPTNADRIRATRTSEELMDAIFHALKMSRNYTDSREGMVDWLNETRWGYPTLEELEEIK